MRALVSGIQETYYRAWLALYRVRHPNVQLGRTLRLKGIPIFSVSAKGKARIGDQVTFNMPVYTARSLGMPLLGYMRRGLTGPMLMGILFAGCLLTARRIYAEQPVLALAAGCASGAVVLAPLYWVWALPESLKARVKGFVGSVPKPHSAGGPLSSIKSKPPILG